ncbi:E3 ubiquitin-protein ligase synoviolin A isoform X3 [Nerophis ophidion]|uniref:E3 ubiquitin-protein ligase synoviolin A isoform X3 n=1 Tax=Nerophis ophidion TaxID=159077 RepID=UPI002ADF99CA|nr:E3 ubiquitin-protein ligase synoviolin A isoform X3 [Nerophis ophidion]
MPADTEVASQSGGYDVEWFVETPDHDLICTICQGVLRCPVRATCHHIFCKKCILRWLKRQETCPCCRKPINACKIYVMFKLSKSIGHLKIKVSVQERDPWLRGHLPPLGAVLPQNELRVRAHPVPVPRLPRSAPARRPGRPLAALRALAGALPHGLRHHPVPGHPGPAQLLHGTEAALQVQAQGLQPHGRGPAEEDEEDAEDNDPREGADRVDMREPAGVGGRQRGGGGLGRGELQFCRVVKRRRHQLREELGLPCLYMCSFFGVVCCRMQVSSHLKAY